MHELISLLANGLIVGFITFQVVINTAIIFTKLDALDFLQMLAQTVNSIPTEIEDLARMPG